MIYDEEIISQHEKSIKGRKIKTVTYFDETSCYDQKTMIFVFYKIYKIPSTSYGCNSFWKRKIKLSK